MRFYFDRSTERPPPETDRDIAKRISNGNYPSKEMAPAILAEVSSRSVAKVADKLSRQSVEEVFDHKASSEYDEALIEVAKLLGLQEEAVPRQRSFSKRLKKHNTANEAIRREELSTGNDRDKAILADPEVYPRHRLVPQVRPEISAPINHPSLCTGTTETEFRREFQLPSIIDEASEPIALPWYCRPVIDLKNDTSHKPPMVATAAMKPAVTEPTTAKPAGFDDEATRQDAIHHAALVELQRFAGFIESKLPAKAPAWKATFKRLMELVKVMK